MSSPLDLRELQREFFHALHYQPHSLKDYVVDTSIPKDQRLQIYRNHFVVGFSDILATVYPCIQALIGEECFSQLARKHVFTHSSNSGDIAEYGADFDQTIATTELLTALPYLTELATLEWAIDQASRTIAYDPIPILKANFIPPCFKPWSISFPFYPNVQCLHFSTAVVTLWHWLQQPDNEPPHWQTPESVLIQHRHSGVWLHPIQSNDSRVFLRQQEMSALCYLDSEHQKQAWQTLIPLCVFQPHGFFFIDELD